MRILITGISILIVAAILFLTRPWSEYNPLEMFDLFNPETRIESFRNMEAIMPARPVLAGNNPRPFAVSETPEKLELSYRFRDKKTSLDEFLQRVDATGLLVVQDNKIVHERYFNGADVNSRHTSWSVAKSFVSTLVGIARDEGRIDSLNDAVDRYLTAAKGTAYEGIPIKHVLQMSSGVDFDETYDDRLSDIQLFFSKTLVLGRPVEKIIGDYPSAVPSGEVLHYASLDTQVLGLLLSELYGQSLASLLSDKLWGPLGMESDALWNIAAETERAAELAFCCLSATLRDYAKLGQLFLQHGQWYGRQIVSKQWVLEATTPDATRLQPGVSPYNYGPRGYQYQWWVPENPDREYLAMGVWGQYIYVSEPDKLVVVRSSVDPDYWNNIPETLVVMRAIRDQLRANR